MRVSTPFLFCCGIFGAGQGMKPFTLDAPGEYHAHVRATYTDAEGVLWVASMRHAGVVHPADTTLIPHGKMLKIHDTNQLVDRGDSHYEGYIEPNDDLRNLDHIDFPYDAGDVLLIASEGDGANKIEPVLTYEIANSGQAYDPKLQPIGATNVRIATSNGMSPHMYPEYITDIAYYYEAGPRPGFTSAPGIESSVGRNRVDAATEAVLSVAGSSRPGLDVDCQLLLSIVKVGEILGQRLN